jgi:uncharacterized protein YndB with AHSA1/START domain
MQVPGPSPRGPAVAEWRRPPILDLTRVLDVPRSRVFALWSNSDHMARWWGPRGFTLVSCRIDFRPGGVFRFTMRGPDGRDYPFEGTYSDVVPPERIAFRGTIDGDNEVMTTVTFVEHDGKTTLSVYQTYMVESDSTRGAHEGWAQTLERLAEYLAHPSQARS